MNKTVLEKNLRARRCTLAVPGSNQKMLEKAAGLKIDQVFFDLEDAVAPNAKLEARRQVVGALNNLDFGNTVRSVRINGIDTQWCHDDIIALVEGAAENIDTIIIPKVNNVCDVLFVSTLLEQLEMKLGLQQKIGLELLIEEVEGLINCEAIAKSTPRLESMIFGVGDFTASQGMSVPTIGGDSPDYPDDIWHYHRCRITIACRAAGIEPIDGPYVDYKDDEGLVMQAKRARVLGMTGKWIIHPSQIEHVTPVFTPDPDEITRARKFVAEYEKALALGKGAISVDGVMIDDASVKIFNKLISISNLYENSDYIVK